MTKRKLLSFEKTEDRWEKPEFIAVMLLVCIVKKF